MKILNYKKLALLVLVFSFSCVDMEVKNLNEPDQDRVLSDPKDIVGLVANAYSTWYDATHWYDGVGLFMQTAADNTTCSWGNQSTRDMSWEPRKAWDNTPSYSYAGTTTICIQHFLQPIAPSMLLIEDLTLGKMRIE
jgi:hypothetical protein